MGNRFHNGLQWLCFRNLNRVVAVTIYYGLCNQKWVVMERKKNYWTVYLCRNTHLLSILLLAQNPCWSSRSLLKEDCSLLIILTVIWYLILILLILVAKESLAKATCLPNSNPFLLESSHWIQCRWFSKLWNHSSLDREPEIFSILSLKMCFWKSLLQPL